MSHLKSLVYKRHVLVRSPVISILQLADSRSSSDKLLHVVLHVLRRNVGDAAVRSPLAPGPEAGVVHSEILIRPVRKVVRAR